MGLANSVCNEAIGLLDAAMIKINHCVDQLSDEQIWWRPSEDINSIGNLLLHISGNLRQWGIVPLSGAQDQRERQSEFDFRGPLERRELLAKVSDTVAEAKSQFSSLGEERLLAETVIQGFPVTFLGAITHTSSHFIGHTQQIILLTRLQLGDKYRFQWSPESDRGNVPI